MCVGGAACTGQVDVQIIALNVPGPCADDAGVRGVEDWCGGRVQQTQLLLPLGWATCCCYHGRACAEGGPERDTEGGHCVCVCVNVEGCVVSLYGVKLRVPGRFVSR